MEVFLERDNKTLDIEIKKEIPISKLLKQLNISTESVIIVKNNEIALEDEIVTNEDKLKLLSVVSGG